MAEISLADLGKNYPHARQELRAYRPTWRDQLASLFMGSGMPSHARENFVGGLFGSKGLGTNSLGLADLVPLLGAALGGEEDVRAGDYQTAAANMIPGAGPLKRAAKRARLPMDHASRTARADAMGFRRDMPIEFSTAPANETITLPAAKVADRVFTGVNHPDALEAASHALKVPFDDLAEQAADGFLTSAGRFVSRHEARDIAQRADQLAAGHPSARGLTSAQVQRGRKPPQSYHIGATAPGLPGGEGVWGRILETGRAPAQHQATELWHRAQNPVRLNAHGAADHQVRETLAEAWDRGHDAVWVDNYIRPGGAKPETILVVRDANQLRSPNARFHPAKKSSANLLAGVAGAAVIAPTLGEIPGSARQEGGN